MLPRTAVPSGVFLRKAADIYPADDVDLLVNGSQYVSHALVDLSAFVNVLSCKVHTMWESRHVRIGGLGGPGPRAISGGVLIDVAILLST